MADITELGDLAKYVSTPGDRFGTNRYPGFIGGGTDAEGNFTARPTLTRGSLQPDGTRPVAGSGIEDILEVDVPRPFEEGSDGSGEVRGDGWGGNPGDEPGEGSELSPTDSLTAHTPNEQLAAVGAGILSTPLGLAVHGVNNVRANNRTADALGTLRSEGWGGHLGAAIGEGEATAAADKVGLQQQDLDRSHDRMGSPRGEADSRADRNNGGNDGGGYSGAGNSPTGNDSGYGTPFADGGLVRPEDIKGPNPPGPDDGYNPLDIGEYVNSAKSVQNYGRDVFDLLNAGIIPPQEIIALVNRFGGQQGQNMGALANVKAEGPLTEHPLARYTT
ncbi:MAG: hypothetical protein HQ483_08085 [Rhodospirillales bacterium]|nr:hypothetical protein [Rhodospirillales bacterium]